MTPGRVSYDRCVEALHLRRELDIAVAAARAAGRIQMERYERLEHIVHKSQKDVVTEVDHLSEEAILATIRAAFPRDSFLAEESGHSGPLLEAAWAASGPGHAQERAPAQERAHALERAPAQAHSRTWVIDPLDGTVNYANGIPIFAVSIGLVIDGASSLGVVLDPARDEIFTALAGGGARLDGRPIHHSTKALMSDAVVSLALPPRGFARREQRIRRAIRVPRSIGSATLALAYVANGRFDAFIQLRGLSNWDICAAGLIASEAGALVTASDGGPWFDIGRPTRSFGIVAAAPAHHATFLEMLR